MLEDNVLIVIDPMVEKVKGLYMPQDHGERSRVATVVAVGPGMTNHNGELVPPLLKVGDRVVIKWHTGDHLHLPGKTMEVFGKTTDIDEITFRIMRSCDALSVIEEE
jgi:chaperonin GroES